MPILDSKYVPEVHTGTKDEIINKLAEEAQSIVSNGLMRMSAQGRELDRIGYQLFKLGADLLRGEDEDEGYLLLVKQHDHNCPLKPKPDSDYCRQGVCNCKPTIKFKSPF